MGHKNIIVVGYPKSGTTWASSLVAELVQCPLVGDWGFDHIEAHYKEGQNRASDYRCYKSHHLAREIKTASKQPIYKIIYIIRDPRDIVISGLHYFNFLPNGFYFLKKKSFFGLGKTLRRIGHRLVSRNSRKKQMIQAILTGNSAISPWFKGGWKNHYKSFMDSDVLYIKYEDLLERTSDITEKICSYIEIEASLEHQESSITKQSYALKKQKVVQESHRYLNKLIRKGESGYWKSELTSSEIQLFKRELKDAQDYYTF